MYLYLHQSETNEQSIKTKEERIAFRDSLVRKALSDYCKRIKTSVMDSTIQDTPILREPKGKPYFADMPLKNGKPLSEVHFSISHSGDWWGCLMADETIGFDLEVCRENVNYEKLARRFFTEEEHAWILAMGQEAFFEVWVRKEAFVKYLGSGLGEGLSSFTVVKDGKFIIKVNVPQNRELRHPRCNIIPCSVAEGVKAAYCCRSGKPILGTIILDI
jgi:4'-phosphopantetheinyl transferase